MCGIPPLRLVGVFCYTLYLLILFTGNLHCKFAAVIITFDAKFNVVQQFGSSGPDAGARRVGSEFDHTYIIKLVINSSIALYTFSFTILFKTHANHESFPQPQYQ